MKGWKGLFWLIVPEDAHGGGSTHNSRAFYKPCLTFPMMSRSILQAMPYLSNVPEHSKQHHKHGAFKQEPVGDISDSNQGGANSGRLTIRLKINTAG